MKKMTIVSAVVAAVLFAGCGEKSKEAGESTAKTTEQAVEATKQTIKEVSTEAKETVKEVASEAKEVVAEAKEVVTEAKEEVAEVTTAATNTVNHAEGAALYSKCISCHGVDGKTKALGKGAVIAGQSKEDLVTKLNEYKAGTRNIVGMGTLMKGQVASMSDGDIEMVAEYITTLK